MSEINESYVRYWRLFGRLDDAAARLSYGKAWRLVARFAAWWARQSEDVPSWDSV